MDRKLQYKYHQQTSEVGRDKRRNERSELRKEKRDLYLSSKRMRVDDDELEYNITAADVLEATRKLVAKTDDRLLSLRTLRQAFSQGSALVDAFLSVDGSLSCLVGLLTGHDPELQLESAWCFTNMAAGTDEHATTVIKHAGAYLVTFLSGGNVPLQDQCAWAIGNLAGGNAECREILRAQGAVLPLIHLLKSPTTCVIQSAAFALSNLAREKDLQQLLVDNGIIAGLAENLIFATGKLEAIAESAWVLTYLAASGSYVPQLEALGIPAMLSSLVVQVAEHDVGNFKVLTPVLRCIGNVVCGASDDVVVSICNNMQLFESFSKLVRSEHLHLRKESLWVLSNLTVFQLACARIIETDLLVHVVALLSDVFDIRKEAAYCLCNMASKGPNLCAAIYRHNAIVASIPLLKLTDAELVHMALCLLEMVFRHVPESVSQFEENRGLDAMETLEYSNNETLRQVACEILENYLYKDDD